MFFGLQAFLLPIYNSPFFMENSFIDFGYFDVDVLTNTCFSENMLCAELLSCMETQNVT